MFSRFANRMKINVHRAKNQYNFSEGCAIFLTMSMNQHLIISAEDRCQSIRQQTKQPAASISRQLIKENTYRRNPNRLPDQNLHQEIQSEQFILRLEYKGEFCIIS